MLIFSFALSSVFRETALSFIIFVSLLTPARGKPITDSSRVRDVMSKFGSKYGDVRKYYPKPDVAVEVPL
jgi:hypothetical protein